MRFEGRRLQIVPTNGRAGYARCRVEVDERLDGSLAVYYQGKRLATISAPPEPAMLRAQVNAVESVAIKDCSASGLSPQTDSKPSMAFVGLQSK